MSEKKIKTKLNDKGNYKLKQTSPETAGENNLTDYMKQYKEREKTEVELFTLELQRKLIKLILKRKKLSYSSWTEETFREEIDKCMMWAFENEVEFSIPLIRVWFNVSPNQFSAWQNDSVKYPMQSSILNEVVALIETMSYCKLDRAPIPSMFKLKSVHKYCDVQKIQIDNTNREVDVDEIKNVVKNLNLDKPKK